MKKPNTIDYPQKLIRELNNRLHSQLCSDSKPQRALRYRLLIGVWFGLHKQFDIQIGQSVNSQLKSQKREND